MEDKSSLHERIAALRAADFGAARRVITPGERARALREYRVSPSAPPPPTPRTPIPPPIRTLGITQAIWDRLTAAQQDRLREATLYGQDYLMQTLVAVARETDDANQGD